MATPIWQTSVDKALASGKSIEAMRTALSNNPAGKVAQSNALKYLNGLHPTVAKLPDATVGPYTKQNADTQVNVQNNTQANP